MNIPKGPYGCNVLRDAYIIIAISLTLVSCLFDPVADPPDEPEKVGQVILSWNMFDISDVTGYRLYYADNKNMENKSLHENCGEPIWLKPTSGQPFIDFSMTCEEFPIVDGMFYITVSSVNKGKEYQSEPFRVEW